MAKTILITGGSRGIGKALVAKFHQEGWRVLTCARGKSPSEACKSDFYLSCDIGNLSDVKQMFSDIKKSGHTINMLINNAGIAGSNDLYVDSAEAEWDKIMQTTLHGTFYVIRNALELIPSGGKILNIASVLSHTGVPDQTAYCAAKHGILGMTRSLARHLAPKGITINAISPGWTRTDMAEQRATEIGEPLDKLASVTPLGTVIDPEEVAHFCWQLADENIRSITGQSLIMDGGFLS